MFYILKSVYIIHCFPFIAIVYLLILYFEKHYTNIGKSKSLNISMNTLILLIIITFSGMSRGRDYSSIIILIHNPGAGLHYFITNFYPLDWEKTLIFEYAHPSVFDIAPGHSPCVVGTQNPTFLIKPDKTTSTAVFCCIVNRHFAGDTGSMTGHKTNRPK